MAEPFLANGDVGEILQVEQPLRRWAVEAGAVYCEDPLAWSAASMGVRRDGHRLFEDEVAVRADGVGSCGKMVVADFKDAAVDRRAVQRKCFGADLLNGGDVYRDPVPSPNDGVWKCETCRLRIVACPNVNEPHIATDAVSGSRGGARIIEGSRCSRDG